jgi:hypothetical protein
LARRVGLALRIFVVNKITELKFELEMVNMNSLEAIQHFGTGLVWYNKEYKR